MIMQEVITTDESNGWVMLKLACGHEVGPVSERRLPKKRKRCHECELVELFYNNARRDYDQLMYCLNYVPMDDRSVVLVDWIKHILRASEYATRCGNIDMLSALEIEKEPATYPLLNYLAIAASDDNENS